MASGPPTSPRKPWTSPLWAEEYTLGSKVLVDEASDVDDPKIGEVAEPTPASQPAAAERRGPRPLRFRFSWSKLWRYAGPGWLMSLAYLDPGNLESNLQQGAYTHFALVWVLWWATVVGFVLQEISARLGLVTGRDLAQTVRDEYPRWLAIFVYLMMEVAVIGADIQEVVGSGIAFNLLSGGALPVWAGCLITGVDTLTFLAVGRLGVRYLEGFVCALIGVMSVCFFINWYSTGIERSALLVGWVIPRMPPYGFTQAIGTIGAVIMPHNLYLHSGLVLSRKVKRSSATRVYEAITYSRIESAVALLLAFVINLAVVATNSSSFFAKECANAPGGPFACLSPSAEALNGRPPDPRPAVGLGASCSVGHLDYDDTAYSWFSNLGDAVSDAFSEGDVTGGAGAGDPSRVEGRCGEIGLMNAGFALADNLGPKALYIWALGLLAAGQASTMVCTYAGQLIMNGCLEIELPAWKRVALTRMIALGPALFVAVFTTSMPGALNSVNEYLNILQSVQLPFAMLPALHFAASNRLLGRFRSPPLMLAVSACLGLIVLATNAVLVVRVVEALGPSPLVLTIAAILSTIYTAVCVRLVWTDIVAGVRRLGRVSGSVGTILRYKLADCCYSLCSDNEPTEASMGARSGSGPLQITPDLIEADATIEGELLGRLLTPEALFAARNDGRAARSCAQPIPAVGGSRPRPPRNLMSDLTRAAFGGGRPQPPPLQTMGSSGGASLTSPRSDSLTSPLSPLTDSEDESISESISPTWSSRVNGTYRPPEQPNPTERRHR